MSRAGATTAKPEASAIALRRLPLAALLLLLTCSGIPSATLAEDWPAWRGPRGDGSWQAPPLPDNSPSDGLHVRWRLPIGGGYAGVSAADGLALVMDRQTAEQATDHVEVERLLSIDLESGEIRWQHHYPVLYGQLDYGNGPRAAPTIHDGRVYTLGALGRACCLDFQSGRLLWERQFVGSDPKELPEWGLSASPVIFEDLVIFHPGARPGGSLVALDRRTGQERWRASEDTAGYATPIVIQVGGGPMLVAWTPEHVLGLSPRTGEIYWSVPYKVTYGVSIATPIYHRGIVFVSGYWEGAKAIRLGNQPNDHELLWEENRQLRCLMSQPLARDGFVYALDKQHGLVCFDIESGKVQWTDGNRLTPRGRNPQASLVWLGDSNRALALNSEGELVLIRLTPQRYEELNRTKIIGPTWAHPAYAGDLVVARDDSETVCVELISPPETKTNEQ